jgi:hypothetical protein
MDAIAIVLHVNLFIQLNQLLLVLHLLTLSDAMVSGIVLTE